MGICTFLTASQHTTPWPPAAARARRASARSFWNVGECFGTGILFPTSEPHGMPWWSWPSGPIPGTLRPPSCCMCHHHSGATGALGLPTTRTVCGPGALLLPVRPRNLQTHVQKIFHRSDVRAQTFQPRGPGPALVDHGNGPNHGPLQKYQRQTDSHTVFVSHTSQGRNFIPQKTRCLPPVSLFLRGGRAAGPQAPRELLGAGTWM